MKENKTTIAGKEVGIAYCYATELAFSNYSGTTIDAAFKDASVSPKDIVYLILAAIVSYYESRGEESPVDDKKIIYGANPKEITQAVTDIMNLRLAWYNLPSIEKLQAEKSKGKKEGKGKN